MDKNIIDYKCTIGGFWIECRRLCSVTLCSSELFDTPEFFETHELLDNTELFEIPESMSSFVGVAGPSFDWTDSCDEEVSEAPARDFIASFRFTMSYEVGLLMTSAHNILIK